MVREISSSAASDKAKRKQTIAARLLELDREIGNLVQAIATMGISEALQERLVAAERERAELKQESARASQGTGAMVNVVPYYQRFVMDLQSALARDTTRARAMLQEIFGRIRLVERDDGLYAEFEAPLERLLLAAGGALPGRVAGEGFEPSTFGL